MSEVLLDEVIAERNRLRNIVGILLADIDRLSRYAPTHVYPGHDVDLARKALGAPIEARPKGRTT